MSNRKGIHPLVWVGVGCLALMVMAGVGIVAAGWFAKNKIEEFAENVEKNPVTTAAKAFAALNPEVDFVSADETTKKIVFRKHDTGEEMTVDYSDLQQGRVTFEGKDGVTKFEANGDKGFTVTGKDGSVQVGGGSVELPAWVPRPDGGTVSSTFASTTGDRVTGAFAVTGMAGDAVLDFYRTSLEAAGFALQGSHTYSGVGTTLQFRDEDNDRSVTVTASDAEQVMVTYDGKQ